MRQPAAVMRSRARSSVACGAEVSMCPAIVRVTSDSTTGSAQAIGEEAIDGRPREGFLVAGEPVLRAGHEEQHRRSSGGVHRGRHEAALIGWYARILVAVHEQD